MPDISVPDGSMPDSAVRRTAAEEDIVIRVRGLVTRFGSQTVHDGLDLDVRRGEVSAWSAAPAPASRCCCARSSGCAAAGGTIEVLGRDVLHATRG